jgi:hypothetical protein
MCGTRRERPATGEESANPSALTEQARLDFLAKSRRHALRRARRKRG